MHLSSLFVIFFLILAVIGAGCTGTRAPASPIVPGVNASLSLFALAPHDLPAGFTLAENREKTFDDVGSLARNLGWDGGYGIRYVLPGPDPGNDTTVIQSIAVYPEENIPAIATMADGQDRAGFNQTAGNLTLQDLGANSHGFSVSVPPVPLSPDANRGITQPVAEIIFSKGRTFEVLRMSGPGTDASTLQSLAARAYEKIP